MLTNSLPNRPKLTSKRHIHAMSFEGSSNGHPRIVISTHILDGIQLGDVPLPHDSLSHPNTQLHIIEIFYACLPSATIQQVQSLCIDNFPSSPRIIEVRLAAASTKYWFIARTCSGVRPRPSKPNSSRPQW
jgi:hypothetical protein